MPTRQQRAARNRRRINDSLPQLILNAIWSCSEIDGNVAIMSCNTLSSPTNGTDHPVPVQITGVPQFLRAIYGTHPTACEPGATPQAFRVTFPGPPLADGEPLLLGPYDPAVRTEGGGYLAQARGSIQVG